jgi:DNA-directed RNA polymerase specialized sigma subunit
MVTTDQMIQAYNDGFIDVDELSEWCALKVKEERLERLARDLESGEKDVNRLYSLTQEDVGDILGLSRTSVQTYERRGLDKLAKRGYDLKTIGII